MIFFHFQFVLLGKRTMLVDSMKQIQELLLLVFSERLRVGVSEASFAIFEARCEQLKLRCLFSSGILAQIKRCCLNRVTFVLTTGP